MVGDVQAGRTRPYHNRYFEESVQAHPLKGLGTRSSPLLPCRKPLVCYFCFEEGHEYSKCMFASISCSSCGGGGHEAEDCPLYFMELSIRGHLTAHIQQRRQQSENRKKCVADKGRFPAQDSETFTGCSGGNNGSSDSASNSATNKSTRRLTFSAVQCIICGCMGHANCGSSPVEQGVFHCPRCSRAGHTAAECPRYPSDRHQGISGDGFDRILPTWGMGASKAKPSKLHKTKLRRHRDTAATRAAAADPWHPLHLLS